jgi:hypothetical protein
MIRKQITKVILRLALLSISVPVLAGVPDSLVSYQGELQNTDGTPISDGFHTIIFSLYTQPDGGVAVWSETQDVSTSGGLFSVMLGRHTPFHNSAFDHDSLFLAVQVAGGAELSPRLRIGTVPYATKSGRVDGDVVTSPGSMIIWSPQSNRSLYLQATDEAASIAIDEPGVHITQLVSPDSTVFDQGSDSGNRVMIHRIHSGEKRLTQTIYPDSVVEEQTATFGPVSMGNKVYFAGGEARRNYHYAHVDTRNEIDEDCDGIAARHTVNTIGTGAQSARTMSVESSTNLSGASSVCGGDLDGDGVPDVVVSSNVVPEVASVAIKTKGTGADKDRVVAACSTGNGGSASLVCDHDSDDDGLSDTYILSVADAGSSRIAIKTKGTAADANRSAVVCSTTTENSIIRCDHDSDGDGLAESSISQSSNSDSASLALATKIDGTPARISTNFTVRRDIPFTMLNQVIDLDNDGMSETSMTSTVKRKSGSIVYLDREGNEVLRSMMGVDSTRSIVTLDCDDDGDGISERAVVSSIDDSASMVSASQGALSVSMRTRKGWDGTVKGNLRVSNGSTDVVDLDSDGDGYFAGNVGIGVPATIHHIEVAGGAYCDGSNWVNASDANLKENFSEVNGEELLSKIDELPVTEWNYKNENTNVKHIGPTAQDFQRTFGVGSDGKSISTIDPSGIALAAIKELNKQNQQLKDQNSQLQQRLEDLQKKVEKLISRQ